MRRVLFVCGSHNQTTQMHAIARELVEVEAHFTPYWFDGPLGALAELGALDMTIGGGPWRSRCLAYLARHGLPVDDRGAADDYDLVFLCQDAFVPRTLEGKRIVLVQEGMTDPLDLPARVVRWLGLPRWLVNTALTGTSGVYERFCVASEGHRARFVALGCDPAKLVITGIPNFDDVERYRDNRIPRSGYVLVCTSDLRETYRKDDRRAFLERCTRIAAGREVIVKLHPNERSPRRVDEVRAVLPDATVLTDGSAEELVANCAVLVVQYSTLAWIGLALGKEVHSEMDEAELRATLPLQNRRAARNIADLARSLL